MQFLKKYKNEFIFFLILVTALVIAGVIITVSKGKNNEESNPGIEIDLNDVNNVDVVESRLDYKMKITQGYLLTYTTNKSGIWYMSSAVIDKIKIDGTEAFILLINEDKTYSLVAEIPSNKVNVKKGDTINFVGTIDLETGNIELAKISLDEINYKDVEKMEFTELVDNINKVMDNIFVIHGYMITDGTKYKLFDSKSSYEKDSSVGNYFNIKWDGKFNYTGNANVTIECKLNGTYKLKDCTLVE
jgi:hypothetical protein